MGGKIRQNLAIFVLAGLCLSGCMGGNAWVPPHESPESQDEQVVLTEIAVDSDILPLITKQSFTFHGGELVSLYFVDESTVVARLPRDSTLISKRPQLTVSPPEPLTIEIQGNFSIRTSRGLVTIEMSFNLFHLTAVLGSEDGTILILITPSGDEVIGYRFPAIFEIHETPPEPTELGIPEESGVSDEEPAMEAPVPEINDLETLPAPEETPQAEPDPLPEPEMTTPPVTEDPPPTDLKPGRRLGHAKRSGD